MSALCIRRTLRDGRLFGLAVGTGIALADAVYASVVAFGLTAFSRLLFGFATQIEAVGGLALIVVGARGMLARPAAPGGTFQRVGAARLAAGALLLTLANPATLVVFAALFAAGALPANAGSSAAALIVLGTFAGSLLWWIALTVAVDTLRARLSSTALRALNAASGAAILSFGLAAVWGAAVRHT